MDIPAELTAVSHLTRGGSPCDASGVRNPTNFAPRLCFRSHAQRLAGAPVAFHTGGLLIDHGWLRVLGSGSPRLPRALDFWNTTSDGKPRCEQGVLVADDVLGGFFAWFREPRTVHYLAPDTLRWEDSGLGYTDWLEWCLSDRLAQFYVDSRWGGWAEEVAPLEGSKGLLIYPPLFSEKTPIEDRKRGPVPVDELWALTQRYAAELANLPDGAWFKIEVKR